MTNEEERKLDKEDMDILDDLYKAYDDGYNQALEDCCNVLRQCWLNGTVANRIIKEQIAEIEKLKKKI